MRFRFCVAFVAALALCSASTAWAQRGQGGPGRGGFGRGGGVGRLALLRVEAVQKELEMSADQVAGVQKLQEELRGTRGQGGQRQNLQDLTQEQRQELMRERRQRAAERAEQELAKLGTMLSKEQMGRLEQIVVQVRGASALQDPAVAKKLGITEQQQEEIRQANQDANSSMREQMQALRDSSDREQARAKMAELRSKAGEKVLAVLSAEQRKNFDEMKGEPFEMPPGALFGGRGGGRRGQGGGGGNE